MKPENFKEIGSLIKRRNELMALVGEIDSCIKACDLTYLKPTVTSFSSAYGNFVMEKGNEKFTMKILGEYMMIVEKEIDDINDKLEEL